MVVCVCVHVCVCAGVIIFWVNILVATLLVGSLQMGKNLQGTILLRFIEKIAFKIAVMVVVNLMFLFLHEQVYFI